MTERRCGSKKFLKKSIGLLNKQKDKDAVLSRVGLPDYLLVFRNEGDNEIPIKHSSTDSKDPNYIPISLWQKYASPVWYDINYSNTLNKEGKESDDEGKQLRKHLSSDDPSVRRSDECVSDGQR